VSLFRSGVSAYTGTRAFTAPDAADPRLRGRTYAVPFDAVWRTALGLMDGGLNGWRVVGADDEEGIIEGEVHGRLQRFDSEVSLRISLDRDAQTRVDGVAESISGTADLGSGARRLARLFRALDRALDRGLATGSGRPHHSARVAPAPWK
jgi:hypothetical protein